jgi:hypothetical protein
MFGWFQRKKEEQAKLAHAYERGRQAAQQFIDDLDKLIAVRFEPVFDGYLSVLQKQFNQCLTPKDAPPIIAARIEYKIFLENVEELHVKMTEEIKETLSSWLDFAQELQCRDDYDKLIGMQVQAFCRRLTETALQRMLDMAHALKFADDEWRADNPELSAKFPPDT